MSSNGQNCFILSQNVPKFELYKHNDELLNIYYRIFYELCWFWQIMQIRHKAKKSFKNLLVRNHWANFNQALTEW
jgi:hypothetical protein